MIALERVDTFGVLDLATTQRNFDRIADGALDAGPVRASLRFGTATLTFTASTNSADTTVAHGLAAIPAVVLCTAHDASTFGQLPTINTYTWDATSFHVNAETKNSWTGTVTFSWIVIG